MKRPLVYYGERRDVMMQNRPLLPDRCLLYTIRNTRRQPTITAHIYCHGGLLNPTTENKKGMMKVSNNNKPKREKKKKGTQRSNKRGGGIIISLERFE